MPALLRSRFREIRAHLRRGADDQPLGRVALALVLLLDAFVLYSIFDGLDAHTRQLAAPWDRIPEVCRQIVIEGAWSPATRLDRLAEVVHEGATSVVQPEPRRHAVLPACAALVRAIDGIRADAELVRLLEVHRRQRAESRAQGAAASEPRAAYDTSLLERAAREGGEGADVAVLRREVRERTAALAAARAALAAADARIDGAPTVAALWARIQALGEEDRRRLTDDLRRMTFWYPAERLGMQLLFLAPLLAAVWAWNGASIRRRRGVQALVSSHLLVVVAIPILVQVADAAYDVLPKRLLKAVIDLLTALNLVAVWHYLVIAAAIAVGLVLVHVVQRKLLTRERLLERRIAKGLCQACGKPVVPGARACVFCGFVQVVACSRCGGLTPVNARFCRECGGETA